MTNSKGGKITHVMADGTRTDDPLKYLCAHPNVTIPPLALRIIGEIMAGKCHEDETLT